MNEKITDKIVLITVACFALLCGVLIAALIWWVTRNRPEIPNSSQAVETTLKQADSTSTTDYKMLYDSVLTELDRYKHQEKRQTTFINNKLKQNEINKKTAFSASDSVALYILEGHLRGGHAKKD